MGISFAIILQNYTKMLMIFSIFEHYILKVQGQGLKLSFSQYIHKFSFYVVKRCFPGSGQSTYLSKSEFGISARTSSLSRHRYILVSSANNCITDSMSITISFI